jgi:hypothetical protein
MKPIPFALLLVSCSVLAHTAERDYSKFSDEAEKTTQERREAIRKEIGVLGKHAWAGEYYQGDGLGGKLDFSLAPKAGYVYECRGCMGLCDRNYGSVEQKGSTLRLSFTFDAQGNDDREIAEELLPIAWGERKYLVPANKIIAFCNTVNGGWEPRKEVHGMSLLAIGDEHKPVTGLPIIPKPFQSYLLVKPIETEIVSVGKPTTTSSESEDIKTTITVTLKHGTKAGLLPEMELYVVDPAYGFENVSLTKVEEQQSQCVFTRYCVKGVLGLLSLFDKNPAIGWRLSTRCPHNSEGRSSN